MAIPVTRERTLREMRLDVLKRADRENARSRFPDPELNDYINESIAELRDLLITARGQTYFSVVATQALTTGVTSYDLPLDFYQLLSVRHDLTSSSYAMEPFDDLEEPMLLTIATRGASVVLKYRLRDTSIDILPAPLTGQSIVYRYIPTAPRLYGDDDTLAAWGWEEYVLVDAARKVATKDQEWELVSALNGDKASLRTRIQSLASKRDAGRPERTKDVRGARRFSRFARGRT